MRELDKGIEMSRTSKSYFSFSARVLIFALTLYSTSAAASFDGSWSVSIVTQRGAGVCDSGASLPIMVSNGRVVSGGGVSVSGQVANSGGINVVVGDGVRRATGSGRLSETSGSGTWRGSLCSGTWTAQKV